MWFALYQVLLERLGQAGMIDWSRAAINSNYARASGGVEGAGKNPTDRVRPGVKHHLATEANGIPLAGAETSANVPDVKALLPLIDFAGPLDGEGEPVERPAESYADRAYDSEPHREELRDRNIGPHLAHRRTEHGSGQGAYRWVVERTNSWLHGFRKFRFVTEKGVEIRAALLNPGLGLICLMFLHPA